MAGSRIRLYGSTSGYVELEAPAVSPDGVLTLPAGTGGFGKTLQVVQTVKTDTFSSAVGQGTLTADALTVTITPSSGTSKVLVLVTLSTGISTASAEVAATLFRDGSVSTFIGDADGSRQRVSVGSLPGASMGGNLTLQFLDSPATTSPVVYSVRLSHQSSVSQTIYLNRSLTDDDSSQRGRNASSITAIEVAA